MSDPKRIGNIYGDDFGTGYAGNVYSKEGISPALMTMQGGNRQPMTVIKVKQATKQGWIECDIGGVADLSFPGSKTRRGRVEDRGQISPTLTTTGGLHRMENSKANLRVRKLTPSECFSLMGMTFEDVEKARALGVSNSALYKQAGNGIVSNCVSLLMEHLYKSQEDKTYKCFDEQYTQ